MQRSEPNRGLRAVRSERGFGLLEVTTMLAVFVLLVAVVTPSLLRAVRDARHDAAEREMRALVRAMTGSDEAGTFGFIGDIGRLPFDLSELAERGSLPLSSMLPTFGVSYGWNGPYVSGGRNAADYRTDPWGQPYDVGAVALGQIRSAGPNGVFGDADDLVYPPLAVSPYGTLLVVVKGHSGDLVAVDPDGCTVTLYYADEGGAATVVDDSPPYSFSDVHRGLHPVSVTCPRNDTGVASEADVATVRGRGAQQVIELHVELGSAPAAAAPDEAEAGTGDAADTTQDAAAAAPTQRER